MVLHQATGSSAILLNGLMWNSLTPQVVPNVKNSTCPRCVQESKVRKTAERSKRTAAPRWQRTVKRSSSAQLSITPCSAPITGTLPGRSPEAFALWPKSATRAICQDRPRVHQRGMNKLRVPTCLHFTRLGGGSTACSYSQHISNECFCCQQKPTSSTVRLTRPHDKHSHDWRMKISSSLRASLGLLDIQDDKLLPCSILTGAVPGYCAKLRTRRLTSRECLQTGKACANTLRPGPAGWNQSLRAPHSNLPAASRERDEAGSSKQRCDEAFVQSLGKQLRNTFPALWCITLDAEAYA